MTDFKRAATVFILEKDSSCSCVTKHVPLPIYYIRLGEVTLCPTTYHNTLALMEEWRACEGEPPGWVTKHYSRYTRDLVYSLMQEG